jgi:DNA mismatch repair protein MutS
MALIKEYFELSTKYQQEYGMNTILLMQIGSFFEVYGTISKKETILEFSRICELNVVDKAICVGKEPLFMAGFKDFQLEKYIKKIQEEGFTCVVYVQDEAAKNTSRSLAGIFSPGTYFSTESTKLTNSIACLWIEVREQSILQRGTFIYIGIANIDIYTGKTTLFEYTEEYRNNPTTYDELERFLSIHQPSEIILIYSNVNIESVICYAGINSLLIHKYPITKENVQIRNCEKQTYQTEIMSKFYKNFTLDQTIATQAFCFLLDFVYQHNPYLVNHLSEPEMEHGKRLLLANHSLKQLNILNDGTVKPGRYSSVSNLLNECVTPMGKRKFTHQLLHPVFDETYLQKEYDMIEHVFSLPSPSLSSIKDLSKWERQVFLKKITPIEFVQLYTNINTIQKIYKAQDETIKAYLNATNMEQYCDDILFFINQTIDLTDEVNFIKEGVDVELDKKRTQLKESEGKLNAIQHYLNSLIESKEKKKTEYVKLHETDNHIGFICTNRRCKLLIESLPKEKTHIKLSYEDTSFDYFIFNTQFRLEKQSAANSFLVEEQINQLCRTITGLKSSLKDVVDKVFHTFISSFEKFQPKLEVIIQAITMIDVLYTKASISKKYKYCKPTIQKKEKSFVQAIKLRHALIEQFQTNELYVTNDITLGDDTDGILLYGTNAVGKTSFIRALGISVIMAQAGMYVPCEAFHYKPYKALFTRIIGNDNLFKGLSTFAVEMSELRTILKLTDENSLILGDELCSGTETQSAISIFIAGIQHFHTKKSSFIFATHLHEIVDYDEIQLKTLQLKHMAVVYDKVSGVLVYDRKLKDGPGDSMYGLEVCKSLALPFDFIEKAYDIRQKYTPDSILSLKQSKYNSKKLVGCCEKCGKKGKEIHHLQYQKDAIDGFLYTEDSLFPKNHLANLMTLCEKCHDKIHDKKVKLKKVKTTNGIKLNVI